MHQYYCIIWHQFVCSCFCCCFYNFTSLNLLRTKAKVIFLSTITSFLSHFILLFWLKYFFIPCNVHFFCSWRETCSEQPSFLFVCFLLWLWFELRKQKLFKGSFLLQFQVMWFLRSQVMPLLKDQAMCCAYFSSHTSLMVKLMLLLKVQIIPFTKSSNDTCHNCCMLTQ